MSDEKRWWITTGVETMNGKRVLGPFDTRELAMTVRTLAETAWSHEGRYWVEQLATKRVSS